MLASRSRWLATIVTALALVALAAPTAIPASPPPAPAERLILGFYGSVDPALIAALGGQMLASDSTLRIAAVYAADGATFRQAAALDPSIEFVEGDDITHVTSTGWDSTGWDSTGWDSTGWDSTGWDATSWDSTGWDSTGWDSTGWDSTGWDSTGWDSTGWDSTGWDSTGWDSTGWDSTGWDSQPTTPGTAPDAFDDQQWGYMAVKGLEASQIFAGTRTKNICVVDSGVDASHPDLAANLWRHPVTNATGRDFVEKDDVPDDDAGHGTHVAGIAAAVLRNGYGVAGIAQARVMAAKVIEADGSGFESDLAMGISWCASNGAHVITMSLGTAKDSPSIRRAIARAESLGIVMVASAGNEGQCGCVHYPAAYPEVLSVGAVMPGGRPAPFTMVDPSVDLTAPGYRIASTLPGARFGAMNGTSQAAPFVAGAAALLLDANASLTAADVAAMLKVTALDMGFDGHDPWYGHGVLDVEAALHAAGRT